MVVRTGVGVEKSHTARPRHLREDGLFLPILGRSRGVTKTDLLIAAGERGVDMYNEDEERDGGYELGYLTQQGIGLDFYIHPNHIDGK